MSTEIEKLLIEARELREKADSIEVRALEMGKLSKIGYDENKFYYTPLLLKLNQRFFYEIGLYGVDSDELRKNIECFKARKRIVDEIAKERLKYPNEECDHSMYIRNGSIFSLSVDTSWSDIPSEMLFPHASQGYLVDNLADDYYTYLGVEKGDFNE